MSQFFRFLCQVTQMSIIVKRNLKYLKAFKNQIVTVINWYITF